MGQLAHHLAGAGKQAADGTIVVVARDDKGPVRLRFEGERGIRLFQKRQGPGRVLGANAQAAATLGGHLFGRHFAHHAPVGDDPVARGHAIELIEHMRTDDHCDAQGFVHAHDEIAHGARRLRVEPVERLV